MPKSQKYFSRNFFPHIVEIFPIISDVIAISLFCGKKARNQPRKSLRSMKIFSRLGVLGFKSRISLSATIEMTETTKNGHTGKNSTKYGKSRLTFTFFRHILLYAEEKSRTSILTDVAGPVTGKEVHMLKSPAVNHLFRSPVESINACTIQNNSRLCLKGGALH